LLDSPGRSGWYGRPNKTRFFVLVTSRWPKGPTYANSNFVELFLFLYFFLRLSKKYFWHLTFCKTILLPPCGMTFGPKCHTIWRLEVLQCSNSRVVRRL
jgi:hypothetical protein